MASSPFAPNKSAWIWTPNYDDAGEQGQFVYFRKTFFLAQLPAATTPSLLLHVSADTRYRLYLNGASISFGPAKSYLSRWYYDSVDIAPLLKVGVNVLAARVLRFSNSHDGCVSLVRSALPGLIVSCEVEVRTKGLATSIFEASKSADSLMYRT